MIKKILISLCVFVFLIGAGVFLYPSFRTAAQRIGGNINQILHRANTVGFIDTVQLRKDLMELREARQMIVAAYNIKSC